jgi:hypothetical protein
MWNNQAACKKCGGSHGIDVWRGVEFYYCPKTNRILLLRNLDSLKTDLENEKQNEQYSKDGLETS